MLRWHYTEVSTQRLVLYVLGFRRKELIAAVLTSTHGHNRLKFNGALALAVFESIRFESGVQSVRATGWTNRQPIFFGYIIVLVFMVHYEYSFADLFPSNGSFYR